MTVHIGNRAIAWYVVFLGIILTIVKLFDFDQYNSKPKDKILFKIKEFTRFIPKKWEENPKSYDTYQEFTKWFQSIIEIYLIELISVLISPLILIYKYKKVAKDVSEFVFQNTFRDQNNGFFVKMSLIENNNLAESKMLAHEKIERSIIGFNNYYNGI